MKDKVARSVFWIVWSRGGIQILSFTSTLIVARLLSPSDFGLMAMAGVFSSTMTLVAEMGLGAAIIQFRDLEERELNACFWLTMGVAGVGYLVLYAAAPMIAAWFASPALSDVLRVGGLVLPLVAVRVVPDSLLRKQLAFDKVSQAEIASAVLTIPVVLGMAWTGAGVWALVTGALIQPLVQDTATFWFMRWWPGFQVGGLRLREILRYSLATLGARLCWAASQQADAVVLGKVSGQAALGVYSVALQLAMLPVNKMSGIVNQLASPVMATSQANPEAMRTYLLRGIRLVTCVTFPVCFASLVLAEDLVKVVLTEKWLSVVPILQVLCLYAVIRSTGVLMSSVLLARYRAVFLLGYNMTMLVVMTLAFWVGATWAGAIGVAVAWVLVYPLSAIIMTREVLNEVRMSWKMLLAQVAPALAASIVMIVAMALARWGIVNWGNEHPVLQMGLVAVIGAAVYSVTVTSLSSGVRGEIQELTRWLLARGTVASAQ